MNKSRFALNLFCQFVLIVILSVIGENSRLAVSMPPLTEIALTTTGILWLSLIFGIFYAFFRLLGAQGGPIEFYYQHFPIGLGEALRNDVSHSSGSETHLSTHTPSVDPLSTPSQKTHQGFNWDSLFTAKYLRYAGFLLIISAIFSMLFRIEWQLIHKVIASFLLASISILAAEKFRLKGKKTAASSAMLVGFAAFQFSITLLAKWYLHEHTVLPLHFSELILFSKLIATILMLPILRRYPCDFAPGVFYLIVYSTPLSLVHSGVEVTLIPGLLFVGVTTLLVLGSSLTFSSSSLLSINTLASNFYIFILLGSHDGVLRSNPQLLLTNPDNAIIGFSAAVFIYVAHLITSVIFNKKYENEETGIQQAHIILFNLIGAFVLSYLNDFIPKLSGNFGIVLLVLSLLPFAAFLKIQSNSVKNAISSTLLQISLIFSALGLFLEAKGPWTVIVFLIYSCGVLWYSLARGQRQTRLFAFATLTASLFKLYFECGELFNSISGSSAILIIGVLLLVLANKMDVIIHFLKNDASH